MRFPLARGVNNYANISIIECQDSRPPIRLQFPGQRIFNACQPTSSWAGGFSCPEKEGGKLIYAQSI